MRITAERIIFNSIDSGSLIVENQGEIISKFAGLIGAAEHKKFPLLPENPATYFEYDGPNKWGLPSIESNGFAQVVFMAWACKVPFRASGAAAYALIQSLIVLAGGPSMSPGSNMGALVAESSISPLSVEFDGTTLSISAGSFTGRFIGSGGQRIKKIKEIFREVRVK